MKGLQRQAWRHGCDDPHACCARYHKINQTQGRYGVDYKQYWVDEENGKIFCLVEAPDADAAISVHREAHGLVADAIFPVAEGS